MRLSISTAVNDNLRDDNTLRLHVCSLVIHSYSFTGTHFCFSLVGSALSPTFLIFFYGPTAKVCRSYGVQAFHSPWLLLAGLSYVPGDNCFATCIKGQRPQRWVSIARTIYFESLVIAQHVHKHDCTRASRRSWIRRCCRHWSELSRYHLCSELNFDSSSLPLSWQESLTSRWVKPFPRTKVC